MAVEEPTKTSAVREVLTKAIIGAGFPVIACFDYQDSSATIYAKSEMEVLIDEYGNDFLEKNAKKPYALKDLTEAGLFRLYDDGIRPGHEEWKDALEEAEEYCEPNDDGDDGDDGEDD